VGKLSREQNVARERSLYVIRNSSLQAKGTAVEPKLGRIAGRSMDMLVKQQGLGDLVRIYATARRDELDFHLAFIPKDVEDTSVEPFDPDYMQSLFDLGHEMAEKGYPWQRTLIGVEAPQ